jgi:predicted transposase/invertase (TIGR01784 family)
MKNNNQNTAQYGRGNFHFGDMARILDIRYDPVFKAVFTRDTSNSRGALSSLISALIGRSVIVDTITANEPPADDQRQRYVRFDAACKTKKGELVNVEMSFNPGADEKARLEYYTAKLFVGQNIHGKEKKYNDLKETYQITILAKYKLFPDENLTHNFLYYDPDTRVSLGGKTRIITVELVKAKPIADKPVEKMTNAEAWAVFFQYLTDDEKRAKIIEIINHEEGIAMAVETLGKFTQSELEYMRQYIKKKRELDYQSDMAHERERMAKTKRKWLKEGRNEGLVKGRSEANLENAQKMKAMGFLMEQIQSVTGLSTETIAEL